MLLLILFLLLLPCLSGIAQGDKGSDYTSDVWVSDMGNGWYKNPILYADYSDPDVVCVGEDYYMTASSFNCVPGLPILHSKDLVNWRLVNHAVQRLLPEEFFKIPQHGNGIWAPCIRHHEGIYYIVWGDPDHGVFMVQAEDPQGEWTKPLLILEGKGIIDPSPLWDDDGQVYLVHAWAGSRAGVNSLLTLRRMNEDLTATLDDGVHVFDGHDEHKTVEGPKFMKRNGYYYIFAPAGGVSTGWQLVLRATDVYGPYEERVILEQGSTPINGPHQGALVNTTQGEWWFIHFQDVEAYGRITHLQPAGWEDDWPWMGKDLDGNGIGEPVAEARKPDVGGEFDIVTPLESDEFDDGELGLQWQWHANPDVVWSAELRGADHLRLFAVNRNAEDPNLWNVPYLLLQKFPAPDFAVTTKVEWNIEFDAWNGKRGGLIVMGDDYAYLTISLDTDGYYLEQVMCEGAKTGANEEVMERVGISSNEAYMRVEVTSPDAVCRFSYSEDGENFTPIGESFNARPDTWIGAKVGLFCISRDASKRGSYLDVDWFRVHK